MRPSSAYREAGVDVAAGNAFVEMIGPLVAATDRAGVVGRIGGFAGAFDPRAAGFSDPILFAATDGVGTKVKVAVATGRHDTIGIDLVAMCVNDLVVHGATPLFFLDYFATPKLDPAIAIDIVAGIADGCGQAGCALLGGETAEMPGLYAPGDYDLAGFAVGAAERRSVLPRADIAPGDAVLGLAASGLHANGFSLVRKIVKTTGLAYEASAPFAPHISLGEALVTPTRIYVKSLLDAQDYTNGIKALAHITGGGLGENISRVLPQDLAVTINLDVIPVPPVMAWLAEKASLNQNDLISTFNCGIGMVVIASTEDIQAIQSRLEANGETCVPLGTVHRRESAGTPAVFNRGRLPLWG